MGKFYEELCEIKDYQKAENKLKRLLKTSNYCDLEDLADLIYSCFNMANRHSIEAADKADYYLETMQRLCELYIQKRGGISNMLDSIEDGFILVALEQVKAHFLYDEFGAVKILLSMLESKQLEIRYIACQHLPFVLPTLDINALKEIAVEEETVYNNLREEYAKQLVNEWQEALKVPDIEDAQKEQILTRLSSKEFVEISKVITKQEQAYYALLLNKMKHK